MSTRNILIYGPTGSGKTGQLGELAMADYQRTGLLTRVYTADKGGHDMLAPFVRAGVMEVVALDGLNPWAFEYAAQGWIPSPEGGKWVLDSTANARVGHFAFESIASWASAQMQDLADRAAGSLGRMVDNVGGKAPVRFAAGPGGEGIWIGSNNESHYGIVQGNLRSLIWKSFRLHGTVTWTSLDTRGEDKESGNPIIAPLLIGKAGVENIPSWFHRTFHLTVDPAEGSKPPIHRLYLCHHRDLASGGMAYALANARQPLGGKPLPTYIEPTSVPVALETLQGLEDARVAEIQAAMRSRQ
jgi:hypothetical protein